MNKGNHSLGARGRGGLNGFWPLIKLLTLCDIDMWRWERFVAVLPWPVIAAAAAAQLDMSRDPTEAQ